MTGSLSRALHLWLPRRTAEVFSRSPVDAHLFAENWLAIPVFRQLRETKWCADCKGSTEFGQGAGKLAPVTYPYYIQAKRAIFPKTHTPPSIFRKQ
jgi:hypothetical protein